MDWMVFVAIALSAFILWHAIIDQHPLARDAVAVVVPPPDAPPEKQPIVPRTATIFAEPGISGKIVDALPTVPKLPSEDISHSSIAYQY